MSAPGARGWVTSTRVSINHHDLISAGTEEEAREIAALRHGGQSGHVQVIAAVEVNYCEGCGSFSDEGNHMDPECSGPWSRPSSSGDSSSPAPAAPERPRVSTTEEST